jgi:hypothetical protein
LICGGRETEQPFNKQRAAIAATILPWKVERVRGGGFMLYLRNE